MGTHQRSEAHLVLGITGPRRGQNPMLMLRLKFRNHGSWVPWRFLELLSLSRQTTTEPGALRHTIISLVKAGIRTLILATHGLTALHSQPSKNETEKMPSSGICQRPGVPYLQSPVQGLQHPGDHGQFQPSYPYVSLCRSHRVYKPSTGHSSRRPMSYRIRRKPLPILLTWNGPLDPQNPKNWSRTRKMVIELACSVITFIVSFATSIFFDAVPATVTQFDTSAETMALGVSLYILGSAFGKFTLFSIST